MARTINRLSDKQLRAWIAKAEPVAKADGGGLTFTLSKSGTASWVLRYRYLGKSKERTLGNYPDMSLADARDEAARLRLEIDKGVDVAASKQAEIAQARRNASRMSFADLAEEWYRQEIIPASKHHGRVIGMLRLHIIPRIGKIPAEDVTELDVDRVLREIREGPSRKVLEADGNRIKSGGAPTVANDALRYMRRIFSFGKTRKLVPHNPAIEFRLKDAGGTEKHRDRVLSDDELRVLFKAMSSSESFGRLNEITVRLLLMFGVRKMELLAARWSEFDLDAAVWHLPEDRTKTERAIDIPLSDQALSMLRELQVFACKSEFVFPARRRTPQRRFDHVSQDTINVALKDLNHGIKHFTVHDLRRTARTILASLGISSEIAERVLNHALKGVEARYNHHDYFNERKAALQRLADYIDGITADRPDNVVPLKVAAR